MRRIGIDVGGTNTDAVLIEDSRVTAAVKVPTTADVSGGIVRALAELVISVGSPGSIDAVMIGTTHFTNAVVERRDLAPVAAVRIGLPASASLPPFCDWPDDLAALARGAVYMLEGGHEYDGRPIVAFDRTGMRRAAADIRARGLRTIAVTAVFSPLTDECERAAADILREVWPDADVTRSHDLGRIGLLERENATLLNASLIDLARRTTRAFTAALAASGIQAPLYLTQNDGTVMRADVAEAFPVFSFASGPTNSMRGAAFLSGLRDAMVVDVGGTTADIGRLVRGFPAEANASVRVGGVRTLFRMPDLLSIGLGGGSIVDAAAGTIGPKSVGHRIAEEALVFGGNRLTATDVAVAAGSADIGDRGRVATLDAALVAACRARIHSMLETNIDRMKIDAAPVPLVPVGGAAFLVPDALPGISEVVVVPHRAVANAIGAAIAQVSGDVDQIFSGCGREAAIERATALARERAVGAGADPAALTIIDVDDLPLAYLPGDARRVRVRVVGDTRPTASQRPAQPPRESSE
ncbi:MAG TPA: hydantoinase/oxoprolinase family protein [Vicinamibacterales bacterium]|nr:hydantoinase/oxoprolinase family protein [Vicinamibacterales bacterium]